MVAVLTNCLILLGKLFTEVVDTVIDFRLKVQIFQCLLSFFAAFFSGLFQRFGRFLAQLFDGHFKSAFTFGSILFDLTKGSQQTLQKAFMAFRKL